MVCVLALFFLGLGSSQAAPDFWSVSGYARPMLIPGAYGHDDWRAVGGVRVLRRGSVLVGGALDFTSAESGLLSSSAQHLHASGNCGVSLPLTDSLRLDLLGEMGGHLVFGVHGTFPGNCDGQSCNYGAPLKLVPFVGALPSVELSLGRRFTAGVGAVARFDILQLEPALWTDAGAPAFSGTGFGRFSCGGDVHVSVRF